MQKIKLAFTGIILFLITISVYAQDSANVKYWIIFKDKGKFKPSEQIKINSEAYNLGLSLLTERAVIRRMKVLPEEKLISFEDLPINEDYVRKIEKEGLNIIAKSKWFNGVSAYMSKNQLRKILKLDFVSYAFVVKKLYKQDIPELTPYETGNFYDSKLFIRQDSNNVYNYGKSYKQMAQIDVPKIHNLGITGKGVLIASFDDGFGWRQHKALNRLNVLAEYDFINKDFITSPEANQKYADASTQGGHGTATLSLVAGFYEGQQVSPAFDSEILLAKTEYVSSETPMEEDFWLEAAEWAESLGADIITSSLVYKGFDKPYTENSYSYEDFDGNTAITTIAGDRATYLGVIVLNAMGNYGQLSPPTLGSAADGDSVFSVGAANNDGTIARFSSNGPTSDGRIKPDFVAQGVSCYLAVMGTEDKFEFGNGTSFSTPITAGVCALILSAHPQLTPMQVRNALRGTANNFDNPNNIYGWGLINAYKALLYYGAVWGVPSFEDTGNNVKVRIGFASNDLENENSVHFNYKSGGEYKKVQMKLINTVNNDFSGVYETVVPLEDNKDYYFSAIIKGEEFRKLSE